MAVDVQNPRRPEAVNLQLEAGATTTVAGAARTVDRAASTPEGVLARVRLTAVNAGSPTLDADVEDSWDGVNWSTLVSFAQLTGVGEETLALTRLPAPLIRGNGVIGGTTPDVDFRIDLVGVELR